MYFAKSEIKQLFVLYILFLNKELIIINVNVLIAV